MPRETIARQAVLVALAALIPLPFVDTWIQGRLRAQMVRELGRHHDTPLEGPSVHTLARIRGNLLLGCLVGAVWWPIKKLVRKVVYVLTVKDAVDALADTFVRGEMVREALAQGLLPSESERVRKAMDHVLDQHTRSPLWGPKTAHEGTLAAETDSAMVKALARTAERGGAAAALRQFRTLLADLDQVDALHQK